MLPVLLVLRIRARRAVPYDGERAPQFTLSILSPFHVTGAFCMSVCWTVSRLRIPISFTVMSAIFRVIRVIVVVRWQMSIHVRWMIRAKGHWMEEKQGLTQSDVNKQREEKALEM